MLRSNDARIRSFRVVPALPDRLQPLLDIAKNLWWTWSPDAIALFVRLDPECWSNCRHNPVHMLGLVSQERLEQAASDESYLHEIDRVSTRLNQHCTRRGWFANTFPEEQNAVVAYFSAEFGLTECFRIYSGGLGVLAGDHLKSASELGIPLVGVGLLYQRGYFQQYLNADGWQQEAYYDLDFDNQPISRVKQADGAWLKVAVNLEGREVLVGVWRAMIGRVPLYLLDTNLRENTEADQLITRNLYGGDVDMRIRQEIILGIAGVRALTAIGIQPDVCHINEGHAAFLALERIRTLIEKHDIDFAVARELAASSHLFTTHTPVPAGIDRFHPNLVEKYFSDFVPALRLDMEGMLSLGRENVFDRNEFFSMAVLALRTSCQHNGVSKLHGQVSRSMWKNIWPGVPEEEVPIGHVTNGVHTRSWLSRDLYTLFNRYLGYRWQNDPTDYAVWDQVDLIPDEELWEAHTECRHKLVTWARSKLRKQHQDRGSSAEEVEAAAAALHPEALTIGFARRFATYKRATLLLQDVDRLLDLLNDEQRPVQFLLAGKSHPADSAGKELIRKLVHFARAHNDEKGGHAGRVVFLDNYDMNVARYMVTGCDIWLNTPRRGYEASGTSGMKACMNGCIHCSILDGWWDEAYDPAIGFAIGQREDYPDEETADRIESESLFDLFENHILPEFYDRDRIGIPRRWVRRMKECIKSMSPFFNTNRMVQEYAEQYYIPAFHRHTDLTSGDFAKARDLTNHIEHYRTHWNEVAVNDVCVDGTLPVPVRQPVPVESVVSLGGLNPDEVSVEIYSGSITTTGNLINGHAEAMEHLEDLGNGKHRYRGRVIPSESGRLGFSVRVLPKDKWLHSRFIPGLITWDQPTSTDSKDTCFHNPNEQSSTQNKTEQHVTN